MNHGDRDTFFISDDGNVFGIAFDSIFEQEQLDVYNQFFMSSKRNFKNLSSLILETYNEIFLNDKGAVKEELALVLFNILNAKVNLAVNESKGTFTSYDSFIEILDKIINDGNQLLIKTIDTYVNENYALSLDKTTQETKDKKKKVNEELQFSDNHAKELLKIAYLYRIMIPVISVYFVLNKSSLVSEATDDEDFEELEFDDVNSNIFAHLFETFAKNPKALRNKLYKLTYSRISRTAYSDKRFWSAAKNVAITKDTEALEIYKKLLTNAIPKLSIEEDKNVISFLQSVINNQIDFLFQNKFKHKIIPLGNNVERYGDEDDDDVSEFERLELQMTRKDEGSYLIRKLNISEIVPTIPEKLDVGVTDIEVKELAKVLKRNSIQEEIMVILTSKYFEDKEALKFVDIYQYCYLLIACKKYLEAHKFVYLPQILTAKCEKHRERVNICGKKVRPEILKSKKFKELFDEKYKNFSEDVENPFLAFVGTTYSSVFLDDEGKEIFDSSVKVAKIAEEMLDLARLI